MPSEKLTRILRSKSPFTEDEIAALSEAEGWDWIYRNDRRPKDAAQQICFTGFGAAEREELEGIASRTGWLKVVGSITSKLNYLCIGDHPGPSKLEKARRQNGMLLDRVQFEALVSDGALPSA